MVVVLSCLLLVAVVSHGQCQSSSSSVGPPVVPGCAARAGYTLGLKYCCENVEVFSVLNAVCCTDANGLCYCDGKVYPMCRSGPLATRAYCPGPATVPKASGRMLNTDVVTSTCDGRGDVGFSINGAPICNGAYAKDPVTGESIIYTLSTCWNILQIQMNKKQQVSGSIFGDTFSLDSCSIRQANSTSANMMTKLVLSPLMSYFMKKHVEDCPSPGCVYDTKTMINATDFNSCFIVSYGLSSQDPSSLINRPAFPTRVGLRVSLTTECPSISGVTAQCFRATTNSPPCLGDNAAPVYCPLNTGEVALFGMAMIPPGCNPNKPAAYNVLPIIM